MRFFVSCGIALAAGASFSTIESEVGESPRCVANSFKLIREELDFFEFSATLFIRLGGIDEEFLTMRKATQEFVLTPEFCLWKNKTADFLKES